MAKIKFTEVPPTGGIFEGSLELKVDGDRERAVYTDQMTGAKVILFGQDLKESSETEGFFTAGTVEKILFKTGEGELIISVTEGDYKAKHFNAAVADSGAAGIFNAVFGGDDRIEGASYHEPLYGDKGDDRIIGNGGEDTIYGGKGDDVLTGGKDSDTFYFQDNDGVGHDRITDFDISGGDRDELTLAFEIDTIGKTDGGKDTLITFENGSTLELDGVTKADFIDYWNTPT